MFMKAIYPKSSVFLLPSAIIQNLPSKLALLMMGAAALSACQPTDSVSNDASNSEHAANTSEDEHPLTSERAENIEALAGVPMQQLVSFDPQEIKQGGDTGISITSAESYSKPSSNLSSVAQGLVFHR